MKTKSPPVNKCIIHLPNLITNKDSFFFNQTSNHESASKRSQVNIVLPKDPLNQGQWLCLMDFMCQNECW